MVEGTKFVLRKPPGTKYRKWKLTKGKGWRRLNWPPHFERAVLEALCALPSLTPEEFAKGTNQAIQRGLLGKPKRKKAQELVAAGDPVQAPAMEEQMANTQTTQEAHGVD